MVVVKDENVQIVLQEFCDQLAKTASMFSGFENVLTGSLEQPEDRLELISSVNEAIRNLASHTHHLQLELEWGHAPKPEWYNHFLGIYYDWSVSKNPFLAERGVFSLLALKHGAEVLELCCAMDLLQNIFYQYERAIFCLLILIRRPLSMLNDITTLRTSNLRSVIFESIYQMGDIRMSFGMEQLNTLPKWKFIQFFAVLKHG